MPPIDGTTSNFSRSLARHRATRRFGAFWDHMMYRPFKGSPRGWQLRAGRKFHIKKWEL